MNTAIGKNIKRKDAWYKVTGQAKYTDDFPTSGLLDARLLTSTHAHARIKSIDISKAPYSVRKQLAGAFTIPVGKIQVKVPFVGGGFGGKAPVTLEILAYLASRSVGGKAVRLTIPREQDMASMPCRLGLEAVIKIGADENGFIQAADLTYWLDCGAYTDISPYMSKAIAMDCTGPYHIENLTCDAMCVYSNHTYSTSFRGFSHEGYTFCI